MKLYYSPGACSLSPHIALRELGLPFELEKVDIRGKKTQSGRDYLEVNPKGYVPALELAPGDFLTEGPAILLHLASLRPGTDLVPAAGTREHATFLEWLVYLNSEIHKGFSPLFAGPNPQALERLTKRLAFAAEHLRGRDYLVGDRFTLVDGYLYTVLRWADYLKIELPPELIQYRDRIGERPHVREALEAEGLLQTA